jgi:hypothetical protein
VILESDYQLLLSVIGDLILGFLPRHTHTHCTRWGGVNTASAVEVQDVTRVSAAIPSRHMAENHA